MALGFFAGLWTATRRARIAGLSADSVGDVTLWIMLGSIVGARLVFVLTYWKQEFANEPIWEIFMIRHGGLVFYGGLIGATVAGIIFLRRKKLPVWKFADTLAPSVALGSAFGRIGCLLNGCCFGYKCDLPWAVRFPADHQTQGVPVHPTQLYDALLNIILYLTLAWLFRRKKFDGQIFALYLMGYAVFRSVAEHFRGDYPADHIHGGLTSAQVLSIVIFATGLGLWFWRSRSFGKK